MVTSHHRQLGGVGDKGTFFQHLQQLLAHLPTLVHLHSIRVVHATVVSVIVVNSIVIAIHIAVAGTVFLVLVDV